MTMNVLLQTAIGVVVILTAMALYFLVVYVNQPIHRHGSWFYDILHPVPGTGPVIAQPMIVIKVGWLVTWAPLWIWRMVSGLGQSKLPLAIQYTFIVGSVVSAVGFLWLIRIISMKKHGHWPWQMSGGLVLFYVVTSWTIYWWAGYV